MKLLDYTIQTGFLPHIKCTGVEAAVAQLVARLEDAGEASGGDQLVAEVMRRETEGSTAIGGGLVIPHARTGSVQEVRVAVATLSDPLEIPADDDQPVDVVILLLGPNQNPRQMLRVLARLARLVKQGSFLDGLRAASDAESLRTAFGGADMQTP